MKLHDCKEVTDNYVEEWLYGDEDKEIAMIIKERETDEIEDLNNEMEKIPSHA